MPRQTFGLAFHFFNPSDILPERTALPALFRIASPKAKTAARRGNFENAGNDYVLTLIHRELKPRLD
jgi:hypothetical protein